MGVGQLMAQEVEVTNSLVNLRNGPGIVSMINHGEMLYVQNSTVSYALGITSKVSGSSQQAITVKNQNWTEVFNVYGSGVVKVNGLAISSDSIFKEEIVRLGSDIDKVKKINAVQYKMKTDEDKEGKDRKIHYGFLAQDLEKVYPHMVHTDKFGFKSIFYTELIPVLLEAVKGQQAEIERQASLISDLDKRLAQLEKESK